MSLKKYWENLSIKKKMWIECGGGALLLTAITLVTYFACCEYFRYYISCRG